MPVFSGSATIIRTDDRFYLNRNEGSEQGNLRISARSVPSIEDFSFGSCSESVRCATYGSLMPSIRDTAICVRTWDWSETSQTAVLLTRNHGMIRVLAKGSKRERSAFSGGLELCTMGEMGAIIRPNSDLSLLTHWDLLDPMPGIRSDLRAYSMAMLSIDLVPRLIQDHDPHPDIYDALLALLHTSCGNMLEGVSESGSANLGILAWYFWVVLVSIGAMPVVDHDVLTGEVLHPAEVYGFNAQLGGTTQDPITIAHQSATSGVPEHETWRVRASTVKFLASLGESPAVADFTQETDMQCSRIARLLGSYIQQRVGTEIPAMRWLLKSD